jgi:hypothetical protein
VEQSTEFIDDDRAGERAYEGSSDGAPAISRHPAARSRDGLRVELQAPGDGVWLMGGYDP